MNVIVRQRQYNRPFTVNVKWLQQIIELDWSISQLLLTLTPEEHTPAPFSPPLCLISPQHKRFNCSRHSLQQLFIFVLMKDGIA